MTRFEQIEHLLTCMKADLKKMGSIAFDVVGGMKEEGCSDHDVDLDVVLSQVPLVGILHQILDKWDNEIWKKYGISLDINIFTV